MELFYAPPSQINLAENLITLSDQEFLHATKALRHKEGDRIHCIDGIGARYQGIILQIFKNHLVAQLTERTFQTQEPTHVSIAISLTKSADRFEFFLEKATELGISEILPMITERTVSRPSDRKRDGKSERWEKIILAATKQSQRFWLPKLHPIQSFAEVMRRKDDLKLIPYELSNAQGFPDLKGKRVLFVIGGEGGFTPEEVIIAKTHGFREISFGKTILRVDTAGIFAVSMARIAELSSAG